MALPAGVTELGTFKGDKGEKGDTGTISSASAESVPAGDRAAVIMSGTGAVKHAHFKVPRGLPGVNAIENDDAVAAYVLAVDSATKAALNEDYPVKRVWDGAAYPPRVPGAVNLFFGPVAPGLLAGPEDYWAGPLGAPMAEIVAKILDTSSPIHAAIRTATSSEFIDLPMMGAEASTVLTTTGRTDMLLQGFLLPDGSNRGVSSPMVTVPYGWGSCRVRVMYYAPDGATGDLRILRQVALMDQELALPAAVPSLTTTLTIETAGRSGSVLIPGDIDLTAKEFIQTNIHRLGDVGADTFSGPLFFTGLRLERQS